MCQKYLFTYNLRVFNKHISGWLLSSHPSLVRFLINYTFSWLLFFHQLKACSDIYLLGNSKQDGCNKIKKIMYVNNKVSDLISRLVNKKKMTGDTRRYCFDSIIIDEHKLYCKRTFLSTAAVVKVHIKFMLRPIWKCLFIYLWIYCWGRLLASAGPKYSVAC